MSDIDPGFSWNGTVIYGATRPLGATCNGIPCTERERERDISAPDNYSGTELALNGVITVDVFIIICVNYTCIMIASLALE